MIGLKVLLLVSNVSQNFTWLISAYKSKLRKQSIKNFKDVKKFNQNEWHFGNVFRNILSDIKTANIN